MGGNKQFHLVETPEGEKSLVAAAFDTIADASSKMVVVLGHRAGEVAAVLAPRQFASIVVDPDAPMIESIKAGLNHALNKKATFFNNTVILLQLGDHPELAGRTLDTLLATAGNKPGQAVVPTYHGKGGHPVVLPRSIAEQILTDDCSGGLRQFWLDRPELCQRIEVDDPGVVRDIDSA